MTYLLESARDFLELTKTKKIALWGCGVNGNVACQYCIVNNLLVDICVDSDPEKHGQSFFHLKISDPKALVEKENEYIVIMTPNKTDEIRPILENWGYCESISYIDFPTFIDHVDIISFFRYFQSLNELKAAGQIKAHTFFHPDVSSIVNPSPIESALNCLNDMIRPIDLLAYLRDCPPYIEKMHKELPYYSKEYINNIFSNNPPVFNGVTFVQEDSESTYVNFSNGLRVTTNAPERYCRRVHLIGPSFIVGIGVEDYYTIASCLQRFLNEHMPAMYKVMNHGARGLAPCVYHSKLKLIPMDKDDVVITIIPCKNRELALTVSGNMPVTDLTPLVQRPHDKGELFYDPGHGNYKLNVIFADYIGNTVFATPPKLVRMQKTFIDGAANYALADIIDSEDFRAYLKRLQEYRVANAPGETKAIAAIVMNCNPFTLGHQYLIEYAAERADFLYIFVVEEDRSFFPFKDRFKLVQEGTRHLCNVIVLPSGNYVISNITFPEYFDKEGSPTSIVDAALDLSLFGGCIAPTLRISQRYAGEEPTDAVTNQYNERMRDMLPRYGIEFIVIPRKQVESRFVSASYVRALLKEKRFSEIEQLVPKSTYDYLIQNFIGNSSRS